MADDILSTEEKWSWRKWFSGMFSGRRYGKDIAIAIRIGILITIGILIYFGASYLWKILSPEQRPSPALAHVSGPSTVNSAGGAVNQTDDHSSEAKTVNVTINEAPLSNGILGLFGSKGKVQSGNEQIGKKKTQ